MTHEKSYMKDSTMNCTKSMKRISMIFFSSSEYFFAFYPLNKNIFDNRLLLVIPVRKEIGNACACPLLPGEG
jgi:hypothetical protein